MGSVFNIVMRIFSTLLGLAALAMGGIWTLQGLHIAFPHSFMYGNVQWTAYGIILVLFSIGQIVWTWTRQS